MEILSFQTEKEFGSETELSISYIFFDSVPKLSEKFNFSNLLYNHLRMFLRLTGRKIRPFPKLKN